MGQSVIRGDIQQLRDEVRPLMSNQSVDYVNVSTHAGDICLYGPNAKVFREAYKTLDAEAKEADRYAEFQKLLASGLARPLFLHLRELPHEAKRDGLAVIKQRLGEDMYHKVRNWLLNEHRQTEGRKQQ